jgi:hypothetical protein
MGFGGEMLRRVFDIETGVGYIPAPGVPFVLPQAMTAAKMVQHILTF